MTHSTLTPVFVGLRTGLHVLFAALLALVGVRIVVSQEPLMWVEILLAVLFAAVYVVGGARAAPASRERPWVGAAWVAALSTVWLGLVALVPEAAYLVFPLFFLYLHVLPGFRGPLAVVVATVLAILALGLHGSFTLGGVVGPLVGAGVAVLIGLGYRALARESAEREALLAELIATRDQLAAKEREQGVADERARLAREIHDTVAQGLSSIQMLLHAAERADPGGAGVSHVRRARETAAEGLGEARRFIRELSSPALDRGLREALHRLAADQLPRAGLLVEVDVPDRLDLPMEQQTALLRVAQGALANIVQHAGATRARISASVDGTAAHLVVTDDGIGFDAEAVRESAQASRTDSFGLTAIRERVSQLAGDVVIDSTPGRGTTLRVSLPVPPAARSDRVSATVSAGTRSESERAL